MSETQSPNITSYQGELAAISTYFCCFASLLQKKLSFNATIPSDYFVQ